MIDPTPVGGSLLGGGSIIGVRILVSEARNVARIDDSVKPENVTVLAYAMMGVYFLKIIVK